MEATVKVFIYRDNGRGKEVLLVLNKAREGDKPKPAGWGMPGGRYDEKRDKDFQDTGINESKEETGLDVALESDHLVLEHNDGYDLYVFSGEIVGGKIRRVSDETDDVDWIAVSEIKTGFAKGRKIYKGDRHRIEECLRKLNN